MGKIKNHEIGLGQVEATEDNRAINQSENSLRSLKRSLHWRNRGKKCFQSFAILVGISWFFMVLPM